MKMDKKRMKNIFGICLSSFFGDCILRVKYNIEI